VSTTQKSVRNLKDIMNESTQNDLSFNVVILDYNALLTTAQCATGREMDEVRRHLNSLEKASLSPDVTSVYLEAKRVTECANRLQVCADTLAALEGGKTRPCCKLINWPKGKTTQRLH